MSALSSTSTPPEFLPPPLVWAGDDNVDVKYKYANPLNLPKTSTTSIFLSPNLEDHRGEHDYVHLRAMNLNPSSLGSDADAGAVKDVEHDMDGIIFPAWASRLPESQSMVL
ncbi:hypothetical protein BDZ97DRAFT_1925032 [Flammula alnicola]|nr:hypothetical protein BDZ97DRAFT_1925032 [Flammula alnicola]